MYFAPPIDYDKVMKKVPYGKSDYGWKNARTLCKIEWCRFYRADYSGYVCFSIVAWASYQRSKMKHPIGTLKANGELNAKYQMVLKHRKKN